MSKEKLKLSLDQENDRMALMTVEEAGELIEFLDAAIKDAEALTDDKKEGCVSVEINDERVSVGVSKIKIEKKDEDEEEKDEKDEK